MITFPDGLLRYTKYSPNRRCTRAFLDSLRDLSLQAKYFYYYRSSWDRYRTNHWPKTRNDSSVLFVEGELVMAGMKLSKTETIRGIEVEIFTSDFDGDPSVGIPYGPETVWAETLEGQPFELTDEEVAKYELYFSEVYQETDSFD